VLMAGLLHRPPLEVVPLVGTLALQQAPQPGHQVCRDEGRSPYLTLPHMHPFVRACGRERWPVTTDDDMAQRHRRGPAGSQGASSEQPCDEPAVQLQDPINDGEPPVAHEGERDEQQQPSRVFGEAQR
jgi:hypothetical protein